MLVGVQFCSCLAIGQGPSLSVLIDDYSSSNFSLTTCISTWTRFVLQFRYIITLHSWINHWDEMKDLKGTAAARSRFHLAATKFASMQTMWSSTVSKTTDKTQGHCKQFHFNFIKSWDIIIFKKKRGKIQSPILKHKCQSNTCPIVKDASLHC